MSATPVPAAEYKDRLYVHQGALYFTVVICPGCKLKTIPESMLILDAGWGDPPPARGMSVYCASNFPDRMRPKHNFLKRSACFSHYDIGRSEHIFLLGSLQGPSSHRNILGLRGG